MTYFLAPTVNSYKRFQAGSFAPTKAVWSGDNRTAGFRLVGQGPALRVECRIPGADVNPYLATAALVGAGLGFLWFNAPPAMVFMGDTGSLSLGGGLGAVAVVTKHELVLAVIGGLFVLETVSVIVQVASFKMTGRRVFRMAPLHHHYEQKGWAEPTIVIRFWIIAVILALVGLATLKLR